jgi:hypothetical protein
MTIRGIKVAVTVIDSAGPTVAPDLGQVLHGASKGRSTLGRMAARIGAAGHDLLGDPVLELLADVARVEPERGHDWVRLEKRLRFRSTQRLRIGELADSVVVAT